MSRNANRVKQNSENTTPQPEQNLAFTLPTTHVSLPSEGKFYPEEHSLHGCDTIEVKQMTTREEEILTSANLLKKGLMVDRLIQSVLVDKSIEPKSILLGDKNAILVALRVDAYGPEYEVEINCPNCFEKGSHQINLESLGHKENETEHEFTARGTISLVLPRTKATVEIRPLDGYDEKYISEVNTKAKKYGIERGISTSLERTIVSVNGDEEESTISAFVANLPAFDSKYIRKVYNKINPDMDMSFDFYCKSCNHSEVSEVPVTANFFWSD